MKIGIISGQKISGLNQNPEQITVETPFGDITVEVIKKGEHEIFYIGRHGEAFSLPPHKVKYRANIHAFASSHVECILSIGTVGSMKKSIQSGDFVIPHDFIDFTKSRELTFFDNKRVHVDLTDPFCPSLRKVLIKSCKKIENVNLHEKGVYVTTEGPRLETATEIEFFSNFADIVGMTLVPEVVLAREKGMCYASLCLVCNMAAGLQERLTTDEISAIYKQKEKIISDILQMVISSIDKKRDCECKQEPSKAIL